MARRKNVVKSLVDSAESAIFAGIEIHNKPRIPTDTLIVIIGIDLYQDKTRPIAIVAKTLRV